MTDTPEALESTEWKLVPVEPTEAMMRAGIDNCATSIRQDRAGVRQMTTPFEDECGDIYRAMLAAAPLSTLVSASAKVGTIGHVSRNKSSLTAAVAKLLVSDPPVSAGEPVEPVAWVAKGFLDQIDKAHINVPVENVMLWPEAMEATHVPLYTASALTAANAERDRLEKELSDWREGDLRGVMAHMEAFRVRAEALEADRDRLRQELKKADATIDLYRKQFTQDVVKARGDT